LWPGCRLHVRHRSPCRVQHRLARDVVLPALDAWRPGIQRMSSRCNVFYSIVRRRRIEVHRIIECVAERPLCRDHEPCQRSGPVAACGSGFTQAETDAGERPGLTSDERAELARLRREDRSVREDVGGGRPDLDDLDHRASPAQHHDSAEPSADTARSRAPGGVASSAAH
jgi:hypothetical protein